MDAQPRLADHSACPYEVFHGPVREATRSKSRAERQVSSRPTAPVQRRLDGIRSIIERLRPVPQRTVWYQATELMPDEFPKDTSAVARRSSQMLSADIARLRRTGAIGWDDVTDIVSVTYQVGWDSPQQVLAYYAGRYRQDYWTGMSRRVAVTIESEQLWDAMRSRLPDLPTPLFGLGGHPSIPLKAELASWLDGAEEPIVLHVGDADGMGFEIERTLAAGIREHGVDVEVRRIWLYIEQAEGLGLPRRVLTDKSDKAMDRAWGFGPGDSVYEAESAPPDHIAEVIRTEVNRLLDADRLAEIEDAESAARDLFQRLAEAER